MRLEGIHHITAITGDAPRNVDFYARLLGLRLVKKTVNFDAPDVYHLYYGDERGVAGAHPHLLRVPGRAPGRARAPGRCTRIVWRVGSPEALDFWAERLEAEGVAGAARGDALRVRRPRGARPRARGGRDRDRRWRGGGRRSPPSTRSRASTGRAPTPPTPTRAPACYRARSGFTPPARDGWECARRASAAPAGAYDAPPGRRGSRARARVHHIAWASQRRRARRRGASALGEAGAHATPIIDRQYFRSIYFREPSGVLFEIATPAGLRGRRGPPSTSARRCACRPSTSTCASTSSAASRRCPTRAPPAPQP